MPTRENKRTMGALVLFVLVIAAIVAATVLWEWLTDGDDAGERARGVTVDGIGEADAFDADGFADNLVGRQVTVSGNVSDMVGSDAIRLGGDNFGGDGILVLHVGAPDVGDDDDVTIVGTVRHFDAAVLERELGTDLVEEDIYDPWVDENVLVASKVTALDNDH